MTYNIRIGHMMRFAELPTDIINNCIIPFSYSPQSPELLHDLKSYVRDFSLITSIYYTQYNECILLNDLEKMVDSIDSRVGNINPSSKTVVSRLYGNKDDEKSKQFFFNDKKMNTDQKNRLLWGLLTPTERTRFFNRFILEDLDE